MHDESTIVKIRDLTKYLNVKFYLLFLSVIGLMTVLCCEAETGSPFLCDLLRS